MNDGTVSAFDVNAFLTQTYEQAGETKFTPLPECESMAAIEKLETRVIKSGQVVMDVTWNVLDQEVLSKVGLSKATVRQGIFLDLDSTGRLAWGTNKNIALGKLREALGQNVDGQAWGPAMMIGQVAKLKIGQRPDTSPEGAAQGRVFNDVLLVARAA